MNFRVKKYDNTINKIYYTNVSPFALPCCERNRLSEIQLFFVLFLKNVMRNARFGPLTLLMTLRVIDVKSDDKSTRLFYVSVHDANIRFEAETVFIGTDTQYRFTVRLNE